MKHSVALVPYIALLLAAVFIVLVMALESACAPAPAQRIARKHQPDQLGQAILDSQNYRTAKQ